jgi:hypothetical protein
MSLFFLLLLLLLCRSSPDNGKCSPDNMDPYVILTCRTQEQKSSVANGTRFSSFRCYVCIELDANNLIANPHWFRRRKRAWMERDLHLHRLWRHHPAAPSQDHGQRRYGRRFRWWSDVSTQAWNFRSCVYRIALQPSKSTSSSFCTNFSSRVHASELSVALYLSPQACLTPLLMPVCTSQLSASPWRLCFRKAAFLRQLTQSSRRRNTAERSSLHSPSLQQWYVPRNVLAAANSHAMPR